MITIPDLGETFHHMWRDLIRLSEDSPAPWTLIGAHMVALHAWARGREPLRSSIDADILVNTRAIARGTSQITEALLASGYDFDGVSPDGIGHHFVNQGVRVDVLAPDGLGPRTNLKTVAGARTVAVPGGTQALRRSKRVEVRTRSIAGAVPLPDLLGAILVKVRAISVDDQPDAQRRDVALLLSLVEDPDSLAAAVSRNERAWLRKRPEFANPADPLYRGLPDAEDAAIVYRRLSASAGGHEA